MSLYYLSDYNIKSRPYSNTSSYIKHIEYVVSTKFESSHVYSIVGVDVFTLKTVKHVKIGVFE